MFLHFISFAFIFIVPRTRERASARVTVSVVHGIPSPITDHAFFIDHFTFVCLVLHFVVSDVRLGSIIYSHYCGG